MKGIIYFFFIGDDESNRSLGNSQRAARTRKITRQSQPEDNIRDIQKVTGSRITEGKSYKNDASMQQDVRTKDKGGGNKDDDDDEDKKTLSQQVADGKYGLIQRELFDPPAERPGILSYEVNPEVPKDNINNLGGLQPEEIWLAENHLLVLSGGGFPEKHKSGKSVWPPIDNYVAPMRQVKIPPNPKVPPPFPVQLKPGGPAEFIKNENGTGGPPPFPPFFAPPFLSNSSEGFSPFLPDNNSYPYPPPEYIPGNFSQGNGPFYPPPPFPFFPPPPGNQNGSYFLPPPGFFPGIPPGAAFLPPPGNLTDLYDEDDPSIYYPPPYDFFYPKDNSSLVPPGPLVPGIVLPPPPDFFAPLTNKTTSKSRRPPGSRYQTKTKPSDPTRKPGKFKPPQILTTIKPFDDQSTPSYYDTLNQVTTPPPSYYSTERPVTNKPAYTFQPTTDNSLNEITPPPLQHVLPPNAVIQGWVPIPAPKPFFITGPRKPLQKFSTTTTLPPDHKGYIYNVPQQEYQLPQSGWLYPNNSQLYDNKQRYYDYFDYYPENKKEQYFSSTTPPVPYKQDKLRTVLFQQSKEIPSSTIASSKPYPIQVEPRGKSLKATYYFYEEPHITQAHIQDAEDFRIEDDIYRSTTPSPPRQLFETNTQKPKISNYEDRRKFQASQVDYFYPDDRYRQANPSTTTPSPLHYYYIPHRTKEFAELQYPISVPDKTFKESSTTVKSPVYEYSFSAPGYGSIEPPKIGITPKPISNTNQLYNRPQYDYPYYDYDATPRTPKQNNYNLNNPINAPLEPNIRQFFTTARPEYNNPIENISNKRVNYYDATQLDENQQNPIHQTENPYHAFFTHHDAGLVDDITKKYFTTFGQKINKDSIRGEPVTTPLPIPLVDDVARKAVYPQTTPQPRNQIKFPTEEPYYSNAYFTTPAPSRGGIRQEALYSKVQPQYNRQIFNYNGRPTGLISPQKPISLEKDTLVNYRQPLHPINPDAEFIDTNNPRNPKPQQSLIQYRLPGDGGGQFYFYTPQAIQPHNYQQSNNGYFFPTGSEQNNEYYKRNTRRLHPQRRKQSEA